MRRATAMLSALGAAMLASGLLASPASAASAYVVNNTSPACSDSGPGTAAQPFCTIGAAAKVAQPGDTVLVTAGTPGSPITFSAYAGVTISGGTRGFALSGRSYIAISGFTITGTSSYGISVSGGSDVTISGNTAHDNSAHGIYLTGSTTGVVVSGNVLYHNAFQYQRNANGIDDTAPGNSIIGNWTYDNEDSGINIYPGANNTLIADNVSYGNGDHGIDDYNVTGGRIIGNTVYGNCTDGINVEGTSGNYVIEDNISVDNATG